MRLGVKLLLVIAAIIILGAALAAWSFLRGGFSARAKPSAMETSLAGHVRSMMIPASAKAMKNPYPMSPERLAQGREHWADHCAQCHGLDGSGNTEIGRNLYPPAPDMRAAATQGLSDGELFYIITNGVRFTGMPSWGDHNPEETWNLVLLIRHLPALAPDELKQMQQMPKEKDEHGEEHQGEHRH